MEHRLNEILNKFEQAMIENFKEERSDYKLKNDYIDLKYDFLKLILEATHKDSPEFNLDLFQSKVKTSSPLWKVDIVKERE